MKKRIAILATALVIAGTLIVGSTLAFFTDKREVNNVITMGNVNITLTEPQFYDSTHGTYEIKDITPNMKITKDPTITNVGDHDAYIRCRVTVDGLESSGTADKLSPAAELMNGINIDRDKWVLSDDGYYYYQAVLPKKDLNTVSSVQLFNTVVIPSNWDKPFLNSNLKFSISISAEAIQADNFTPTKNAAGKITAWQYKNGTAVAVESSVQST